MVERGGWARVEGSQERGQELGLLIGWELQRVGQDCLIGAGRLGHARIVARFWEGCASRLTGRPWVRDRDRVGVDVLIIAALYEELLPLLAVRDGVVDGWREDGDLVRATLVGDRGFVEVAAAWLAKTGGISTATDASALVQRLGAKCLAMCGVCGGHPSDTEYGDVVIAERVTQHDEGKRTGDGFRRDLWVHAMPEAWRKEALARANKPATGLHGYLEPDVEASKWWMLERIAAGENVRTCKAASRYLPATRYQELVRELETRLKYIKGNNKGFVLTKQGQGALDEYHRMRPLLVDSLPYHTQVGVIVSGNAVEADGSIWKTMAEGGVRKVVAVEMEAFAIGHIAAKYDIPFVVCKGVMDHADPSKSDNYKPFAARASAEVLCSFLRKVCEPAPADASASRAKKVAKKPAKKAARKASEPPRAAAANLPREIRGHFNYGARSSTRCSRTKRCKWTQPSNSSCARTSRRPARRSASSKP